MTALVRLYTPADWFGGLIAWRLESSYCHATIEIDGTIYSATFPQVLALPPGDPDVAQPPRGGVSYEITLSPDEKARALAYCQSMVGTSYDVLAIAGWALRIESMQRPGHAYCFEYVADALAAAGVFPTSKRLITGEQLLLDLYRARRIDTPPRGTTMLALLQKRPVTMTAPRMTLK